MKSIFLYADSLSWGIVPGTRRRLDFEQRWPGVAELGLAARGMHVRIIEDCLNGRRTVWEDPFKTGRNGLTGLQQRMEVNSPLSLVILMLGTNDFQSSHPQNDAWASAQGLASLILAIRAAPVEPGMPVPPILIASPPPIVRPSGTIAMKFRGAAGRSAGLALAQQSVAAELSCSYFDAATVCGSSVVDGVHLDAGQHRALGEAMVAIIQKIFDDGSGEKPKSGLPPLPQALEIPPG